MDLGLLGADDLDLGRAMDLLPGERQHVPTWLVLVVIAATAVALVPLAGRALRNSAGEAGTPAEAGVPVSVS